MKKILSISMLALLGISCSTTEFDSFKTGPLIAQKEELNIKPLSKEIKVSLSDVDYQKVKFNLSEITISTHSWTDKYRELAVYKERCKGWIELVTNKETKEKECLFNNENFLGGHVGIVGFLYDLIIPFKEYSEDFALIEKETENVILENKAEIVKEENEIIPDSLAIEMGDKKKVLNRVNGTYSLDYSELQMTAFKTLQQSIFLVLDNEKKDITELYKNLIKENINKRHQDLEDEKRYKREEQERIRKLPTSVARRHSLKLCTQNSLETLLQMNRLLSTIEKGCLYKLYSESNYPFLKVLQTNSEGILASFLYDPYGDSPLYFIKTKKSFIDDQPIRNMYFKYIGPISYTTVLGGLKTVHGFQFLEEVN